MPTRYFQAPVPTRYFQAPVPTRHWCFRHPRPCDLQGPVGDGFQRESVQVNSVLYGLEGLYVADASLMPTLAIAEKAAKHLMHL